MSPRAYNFINAVNKAHKMLFYLKLSFATLTPASPVYKLFIWPHLEYDNQTSPPILSRDAKALEKVQKLTLKFKKDLRHNPYESPSISR